MKTESFYENIKKEILDGIKTMKDCGIKCNKLEIDPQYVLDMIENIEILKRALEITCDVIRQYVKIVHNCDTDKIPNLSNLEDYYLQVAKYGFYKYNEKFIEQAKGEKDE